MRKATGGIFEAMFDAIIGWMVVDFIFSVVRAIGRILVRPLPCYRGRLTSLECMRLAQSRWQNTRPDEAFQ